MCKGYSALINDKTVVGGGNSHTELCQQYKLNEDKVLKINVIYDDSEECGYRIEVDNHGVSQIEHYKSLGMLTKSGKIIGGYMKRLVKHCEDNAVEVFRALCTNMQGAKIATQDNDSAEIATQYNYSAKIDTQDNGHAKIADTQCNRFAKIARQNNRFAKIDIMIIYNTIIGNKDTETSKLIAEFSDLCEKWQDATLTNFIGWLGKKGMNAMSKLPKRHTLPETTDKTEEAEVEPMTLETWQKYIKALGPTMAHRLSKLEYGSALDILYDWEAAQAATSAEIERLKIEITENNYGGEIFRRQISDLRDKQAELLKVVAIDNETIIDLKQKLAEVEKKHGRLGLLYRDSVNCPKCAYLPSGHHCPCAAQCKPNEYCLSQLDKYFADDANFAEEGDEE